MAKTKAEKAIVIEKLEDAFKNSASAVLVHFKGLSVADESAMRRALRGEQVKYLVAKKTLVRRALSSLGHAHDALPLEGELAVAYGGGEDSTAAGRLVHAWADKLKDKLAIVGGVFEGALKSQSEMMEIATIPPLESLRAMFAQLVNSPRQRFAVVLSKVAETKTS